MENFKETIITELGNGFTLAEANYNVENKENFSLVKGDVVQIDLRPRIQKLSSNLEQLKKLNLHSLEYDPVTKKVSLKQSIQSPTITNKPVNIPIKSPNTPRKNNPVVDFLKMLKNNGSLEKVANLDPKIKKKIANAIYDIVNGGFYSEEEYHTLNEVFDMIELKDPKNTRDLKKAINDKNIGLNQTEPTNKNAGYDELEKYMATKPGLSLTRNNPIQPKAVKNSNTPKIGYLMSSPGKYINDPRLQYVIALQKELEKYLEIKDADVGNEEFLAVVNEPDGTGKVSVTILKPEKRDSKTGKVSYGEGEKIIIRKPSIVKRTPAEKSKGFLSKVAGWFFG